MNFDNEGKGAETKLIYNGFEYPNSVYIFNPYRFLYQNFISIPKLIYDSISIEQTQFNKVYNHMIHSSNNGNDNIKNGLYKSLSKELRALIINKYKTR